jgi:hypothetical protein
MRRALLLAFLLAFASGCASDRANRLYFLDTRADEEHPATFAGLPLKDGQIVLCEGPGAYSFLFSLGTEGYSNFTHAGVIVFEEGVPHVYEMTGEYKAGGFDDSPTDGIVGECRRLPFLDYAMAYLYIEVYDPPEGVDPKKVTDWVRARYEEKTPFDPYFSYAEHEALFCTEFVQLALEAGGDKPTKPERVRQHPDLQRMLVWASVANEWSLPAGSFFQRFDPKNYRGALGMLPSRTAAYCYFAAKAELHRRFTLDQRLGNMFRMDGFADIELRPAVSAFLSKAVRLFPVSAKFYPREEITERVQALAAEMFGVASASHR